MDRRKTLRTKDFAPAAGIRPAQVTWCPRCRQHRTPGGRFLGRRVVLRGLAAEADRVRAEIAVRATSVPPPATGRAVRAARMSALLFDTPRPRAPRKLTAAEARTARTAQILWG